MAIRSGFFNSVNGDRKYDAARFAEYFASFISNGVFPNPSTNLQVVAQTIPDMTVIVRPGKAWINGYILINDGDYVLQLDPADGVLNRIDRVVARYDVKDREIRLEVKKGTFASSPVAPTLQRDADAYELGIADIYVAAGAVSISQANITDLRMNSNYCGIVAGTVDQIDTTGLFAQYQAAFEDWFQELEDVLDDNAAANLLNIINEHKNDKVAHIDYAVASGTNTYTANIQGITSLVEGLSVKIKFQNENTGASTLNINGLGAKEIRKSNGNTLSSGNIKAGQICHLVYTGSVFQLLGEGGEYGTAQPEHVLEGYTIGTESGIVAGTMPNHGSKTFTPNDTTQTGSAGYYSGVTVNPRPTLSGNATPDQVLAGRTFYNNSYTRRTGTLVMPIPYSSVWTQRTSGFGTTHIFGVTYGNNMFVAVGADGKLATSTDGITWTQRTSGFGTTHIFGVTYGNNMFVAVGSSGKLATSTDGITWTQHTSSFGTAIRGVAYGNNMFVAVGVDGKLATSTNGTTWTQRTSSFGTTHIVGVTYGNNMFVAVGYEGKLATSTDGITWTQRTSGFGTSTIQGVAYGNNMFVAVGYEGKLATSTDGITWTQRTSSFGTTHIFGVTYGNNMFVAVGDSGKLAISTDGTTWTQRTSGFGTSTIQGVAYGNNNMFVAVGADGKLATLS